MGNTRQNRRPGKCNFRLLCYGHPMGLKQIRENQSMLNTPSPNRGSQPAVGLQGALLLQPPSSPRWWFHTFSSIIKPLVTSRNTCLRFTFSWWPWLCTYFTGNIAVGKNSASSHLLRQQPQAPVPSLSPPPPLCAPSQGQPLLLGTRSQPFHQHCFCITWFSQLLTYFPNYLLIPLSLPTYYSCSHLKRK